MDLTVDEFVIADQPEAWAAAGFCVDDDGTCRVGNVGLRFVGPGLGIGIIGWSLRGLDEAQELDGVPTASSTRTPAPPSQHPNGVTVLDHAVLMSPDLARTEAALESIGLLPRRRRDGELGDQPIRQIFYRLGEVVLELVGSPDSHEEGPAHFWGLTFTVADLDASASLLGENVSRVKDAVQPGRRITTVRHRALGMSVATALISPDFRRTDKTSENA